MKILDCQQRSPEWYTARLGKVTSSCAADLLATLKDPKKEAAARRNLRVRLVLERVTGRSQESEYVSAAMQDGIDRELDAQTLYEAVTGQLLTAVGFVAHDELQAGCSPDGVVNGFAGIAEIKCPTAAIHWEYLRTGIVPTDYQRQIVHHLWITGAAWCDWLSFHPQFPEPLRVKLVRVVRDRAAIDSYELLVRQFLREVDAELAELQAMAETAGAVA